MNELIGDITFVFCLGALPFLVDGFVIWLVASLNGTRGASVIEPLVGALDRLQAFRIPDRQHQIAWALQFGLILAVALMAPWLSFKPQVVGSDLFLLVFLLLLLPSVAYFTGGRKEIVCRGVLMAPTFLLALVGLCLLVDNQDMQVMFVYPKMVGASEAAVWMAAAVSLFVGFVATKSDENTDTDYVQSLMRTIMFGLIAQCVMHALSGPLLANELTRGTINVGLLFAVAGLVALSQRAIGKAGWKDEQILTSCSLLFGIIACLIAASRGSRI